MVTLKDIAAASGVSAATVSYVMNRRANVKISALTRHRVLSAAKQLGYEPNELARSVRRGYSNVIALVSSTGLDSDYFYRIFNSICRTATENDFALKVFSQENGEAAALRMLVEQRVSGVIFHCASFGTCRMLAEEMQRRGIPIAAVNCRASIPRCASFASDDRQGAYEAVRCLYRAGCRRIGCMTHRGTHDYIRLRDEGYRNALRDLMPDAEPFFIDSSTFDAAALAGILQNPARCPDGVFCIADNHAFNLYQVAYKLGIRVPDELSVIGFGNLSGASSAMVPLTTVRQEFEEMGRLAAQAVISAVMRRESATEGSVELPASVLMRESVANQSEFTFHHN